MIITFVMDQYGETSNGTSSTAMRFAEVLKRKGHEVRVLTASKIEGEGIYVLPEHRIPVFQYIIDKNGMKFAKPDQEIIRKAIEGSDVVHMLMPFKVQKKTVKIANDLRIATTAAFHLQPENITYSIKMQNFKGLNSLMYKKMKKFYDNFSHIHCPSVMLEHLLEKYKYRSTKHVISNGIDPDFKKNENAVRPAEWGDRYVIVMAGRFSREKRQDVLIRAVAASKYADRIQLVLCGRGPWQKKLERLSRKLLPHPATFRFCSKQELIDTLSCADLYVHASEVELEAISCMEAFACGLVPVISDSETSATKQFALTEDNLFSAGDSAALRDKIDWYIEHPQEKEALARRYTAYAAEFAIDPCVDKMIEVFETAVAENRCKTENRAEEARYLESCTVRQRKEYLRQKKKYVQSLHKQAKEDYIDGYIRTVTENQNA